MPTTIERYVVRRGDTLEQIARDHDVDMATLMRVNPSIADDPDMLWVGSRLRIPVSNSGVRLPLPRREERGAPTTEVREPTAELRGPTTEPLEPTAEPQQPTLPPSAITAPPLPSPLDWPDAKPRTIGPRSYTVELVQRALNRAGIDTLVDGRTGRGTTAAVKDLQKAQGLSGKGVIDQSTWSALRELSATPHLWARFTVSRDALADAPEAQNAYDILASLAYEDPERLRAIIRSSGHVVTDDLIVDRELCQAVAQRARAYGFPLDSATLAEMRTLDHDGSGLRGYDEARAVSDFIALDVRTLRRVDTDRYDGFFRDAVARSRLEHPDYPLPAEMPKTMAAIESAFNPRAGSSAGARGVMQLMPGTARAYHVRNRNDPQESIHGGTAYLGDLYASTEGNAAAAFAIYNSGRINYRILESRDHIRRGQAIYTYYRVSRPLPEIEPEVVPIPVPRPTELDGTTRAKNA